MKPWVRKLALLIFGASGLMLTVGGAWYQGLFLWFIALYGVILIDRRLIESRLPGILPKLYVCAKPQEYLEWIEDLRKDVVFKNLFEEKLNIYLRSGQLYEIGRAQIDLSVSPKLFEPMTRTRDPLKLWERTLLSPADRQRMLLNDLYTAWLIGGESVKNNPPNLVKQSILEGESAIKDIDNQKTLLILIGKMILAKWHLAHQQRQEAERLFTELRESEVFNLMFGEVNYHLGIIEMQKKQHPKAAYFFKVAENFADGTALDAMIQYEKK